MMSRIVICAVILFGAVSARAEWETSRTTDKMTDGTQFMAQTISDGKHLSLNLFCKIEVTGKIQSAMSLKALAIYDYDSERVASVQFRFDKEEAFEVNGSVDSSKTMWLVIGKQASWFNAQYFEHATLIAKPDLHTKAFVETFDVTGLPRDFFPAGCF